MNKQIFINKFEKGSTENPNVGISNMVGFDLYSKKGVAKLAKKSTIVTNNFTGAPTFMDTSNNGAYIWVQCDDKSVLYSADGGSSWTATDLTSMTDTGHGNGLIFFQNYMIAFTDTKVYYWKDTAGATGFNPTAGAWVDWTAAKTLGLLQANIAGAPGTTNPIEALHFPYLFQNNRGVYFGNGGAGATSNAVTTTSGRSNTIGIFGQVGQTLFNPAGTLNTDFLWNNGILQLPSSTWSVGSLDFLPPNNLAIACNQYNQPAVGADLITWDTVSTNKFTPPLRIYGNTYITSTTGLVSAGIKQLINRNQVLYAVTGGNHSVFETNSSSYNLVNDIALFSNVRATTGAETDYPVYLNSYPSAICIVGNKLFTGVSTMTNLSTYPPASNGIFPIGVWSISFNPDGSKSTQCEFTIPYGNISYPYITSTPTSPAGNGNFAKITLVKPIPQVSSTSQILVGFRWKETTDTIGVALVDLFDYIDDRLNTALESELFEIGTPLVPQTVSNIQINLVKKLLTNQKIDLSYRTGIDQDWTNITYQGSSTITGDGTESSYKYTSNPIGATQFLQLRVRMETVSTSAKFSPEIRSIIIE